MGSWWGLWAYANFTSRLDDLISIFVPQSTFFTSQSPGYYSAHKIYFDPKLFVN